MMLTGPVLYCCSSNLNSPLTRANYHKVFVLLYVNEVTKLHLSLVVVVYGPFNWTFGFNVIVLTADTVSNVKNVHCVHCCKNITFNTCIQSNS